MIPELTAITGTDRRSRFGSIKIIDSGNGVRYSLTDRICDILDIHKTHVSISKFADGDTDMDIHSSVRGSNAFLIMPYYKPIGERLYEAELILNGLQSGSPAMVNVIQPFAYGGRGERRNKPRGAINAVVVAKKLKAHGVSRLITLDIHSQSHGSIYDALDMKFENLQFEPLAAHYAIQKAQELGLDHQYKIASPDVGGATRVRSLSKTINKHSQLETLIAIVDKRREEANESEVLHVLGKVKDCIVFLYDDIGDTFGSLTNCAVALLERGAATVYAMIPHMIGSQNDEKNGPQKLLDAFNKGLIEEVLTSDSLPCPEELIGHPKIKTISVAPLIAASISRIHHDLSVSELLNYEKVIRLYHIVAKEGARKKQALSSIEGLSWF